MHEYFLSLNIWTERLFCICRHRGGGRLMEAIFELPQASVLKRG